MGVTNVTTPVCAREKDAQKPITWVTQHTLEKFSKVMFKLGLRASWEEKPERVVVAKE